MLNHNVSEVYLAICPGLFSDRLSPAFVNIYPRTRNSREDGSGGELRSLSYSFEMWKASTSAFLLPRNVTHKGALCELSCFETRCANLENSLM